MNQPRPAEAAHDERLAESTTEVPTRLGRLHVRSIGEGTPTILWSSMFVDSHTWDPVVPLLPSGRRYQLVDPPGLGASESLRPAATSPEPPTPPPTCSTSSASAARSTGSATPSADTSGSSSAPDPGVLRSLVAVSSPTSPSPHALRTARSSCCCRFLRPADPSDPCARRSWPGCSPTPPSRAGADPRDRHGVPDATEPGAAWPWPCGPSSSTASTSPPSSQTSPCRACSSPPTTAATGAPQAAESAAGRAPFAESVIVRGARTLIPLEQPERLASHLLDFWGRLR